VLHGEGAQVITALEVIEHQRQEYTLLFLHLLRIGRESPRRRLVFGGGGLEEAR
jgi:hypothetical protein